MAAIHINSQRNYISVGVLNADELIKTFLYIMFYAGGSKVTCVYLWLL